MSQNIAAIGYLLFERPDGATLKSDLIDHSPAFLIDFTQLNQVRNRFLLDFSELGLTDISPFTNSLIGYNMAYVIILPSCKR